jgi:2-oxoglutarate dehydrogenase E1 component
VYFDILEQKEKMGTGENIAAIRLEQLYPFPEKQLRAVLAKYPKGAKVVWVQEEPENMGPWSYMMRMMRKDNLDLISPPASASPAAGSPKVHDRRHQDMLNRLLGYSKVNA